MIFKIIFYSMVWSLCGALFLVIVGVLDEFDDFSFLNPIKIYKTYRVNYFGATLICITYNLLCPLLLLNIGFTSFVPLAASNRHIKLYE